MELVYNLNILCKILVTFLYFTSFVIFGILWYFLFPYPIVKD